MESSLCEKPECHASRRLSDHLTFEGQNQKVHSLVDKVYSRENLKLAWERVRANRGASGADRVTIGDFEANLDGNLERLHRELREQTYQPQAVRRLEIPKRGAPGKTRPLGIPSVFDYLDETLSLYRDGRKRGVSTGWKSLDEFMTIRPGELSVVTGVPGSGKSEFIDALAINLAQQHGWRFALCSFENPPAEHIAKLAEKYLGAPFWDGLARRMSETDLQGTMDWIADRFHLIRFDDEAPTIEAILEKARAAVMRHGIRGLVIEPYNEIEHRRPSNMTETEYISQLLGKVKRFAQHHAVHVWFIAHPAKLQRDNSGARPIPTLYDIAGSANWVNKADLGIVMHRDPDKDQTASDIQVRKVRFKSVGKIGTVTLRWDRATGRYSEIAAGRAYAARAYPDD